MDSNNNFIEYTKAGESVHIANGSSKLFALIIAPIVLVIWRMGLFRGADAFALIAIAIIAPQFTLAENIVTPITTLSNAAVLFVVPLMINAVRNIVSIMKHENIFEGFEDPTYKKILASFLGYKAKNPKYGFSIEKNEHKVRKFVFSFHNADNAEFSEKPNTWITPGIPYLLLIIGGFLIQLVYGDIIVMSLKLVL
ncbi:MAG: peptidase [Nitrosopumilus sp.]|nr:peptidase [Nitrosopumilus sp.]MDF2424156.1 peptidase [Nitrosopumilus sp.]MDF2425971.1 peptidase [Nitrosopumilus sp.]MDF2427559.1 peptidase [Nitrosopumilus sp.]MDF2428586.1 peptidase [Nitrosopumilus sp.]